MFEWLVYIGGLADVEVPVDEPIGGYVIADRGKPAKFPKAVADSLLEHGKSSDPDEPHDAQWRKATAKEIAAAEKAANGDNDDANAGPPPAAQANGEDV